MLPLLHFVQIFSALLQRFTWVTCSDLFQIKVETFHDNGQSKATASPAKAADPQPEKVSVLLCNERVKKKKGGDIYNKRISHAL